MKILIIRFSSIGDIVLTTPVVRCVKEQVPDAEVHYLTKQAYRAIVANNPHIDKVHTLTSIDETAIALKQEAFDVVIDLHKNLRSFRIRRKLGLKTYAFDKLNIKKWLLVNFKINKLPQKHIVDRYMEAVKLLNVSNDNKGLDFYINAEDEIKLDTLPQTHANGYVAFSIGGAHKTKCLPNDKLISICKAIDKPIILLGGKDSSAIAEELEKLDSNKILNYCGKLNIGQSASILKQANLVISHDTGLMHIASAFHKKIISIWGNTVPAFGMYPYLPLAPSNNIIIENKELACRPCSKIGYDTCPKGHFKCMHSIDEQQIVDAVNRLYPSQ